MTTDQLSERATQVLTLTKAGKNPTDIGAELGITSQAVHGHLRRLRDKDLLPPDPKAKAKARTENGRPDFTVDTAFAEVRASIARQRDDLDTYMVEVDRELERIEERKKELKKERAEAEKAKERLAELEATV